MPEQLDLAVKIPAPEVTPEEINHLCSYLAGRGWLTARQIAAEIHIDDRRLRLLAEHSDGRILSGPGCPGYRLFTGTAEVGEADAAASRLESQAKKMLARAAAIRRRFHRYASRG